MRIQTVATFVGASQANANAAAIAALVSKNQGLIGGTLGSANYFGTIPANYNTLVAAIAAASYPDKTSSLTSGATLNHFQMVETLGSNSGQLVPFKINSISYQFQYAMKIGALGAEFMGGPPLAASSPLALEKISNMLSVVPSSPITAGANTPVLVSANYINVNNSGASQLVETSTYTICQSGPITIVDGSIYLNPSSGIYSLRSLGLSLDPRLGRMSDDCLDFVVAQAPAALISFATRLIITFDFDVPLQSQSGSRPYILVPSYPSQNASGTGDKRNSFRTWNSDGVGIPCLNNTQVAASSLIAIKLAAVTSTPQQIGVSATGELTSMYSGGAAIATPQTSAMVSLKDITVCSQPFGPTYADLTSLM